MASPEIAFQIASCGTALLCAVPSTGCYPAWNIDPLVECAHVETARTRLADWTSEVGEMVVVETIARIRREHLGSCRWQAGRSRSSKSMRRSTGSPGGLRRRLPGRVFSRARSAEKTRSTSCSFATGACRSAAPRGRPLSPRVTEECAERRAPIAGRCGGGCVEVDPGTTHGFVLGDVGGKQPVGTPRDDARGHVEEAFRDVEGNSACSEVRSSFAAATRGVLMADRVESPHRANVNWNRYGAWVVDQLLRAGWQTSTSAQRF